MDDHDARRPAPGAAGRIEERRDLAAIKGRILHVLGLGQLAQVDAEPRRLRHLACALPGAPDEDVGARPGSGPGDRQLFASAVPGERTLPVGVQRTRRQPADRLLGARDE